MRIDWRETGRKARIASLSFLTALVAFWVWWFFAANSALAGTYEFRGHGATSTLLLRKDATFHQILRQNGQTLQADGSWRRIGEGRVNFSPEFLRVPGAQTFIEEQPGRGGDGSVADNEFYGEFKKFLGIYPSLHLDGDPDGPVFHKRLFR
ncbi:MAG TPA: hypothetical protein VN734_13410 [Acidobacteriaceae bacterium]|nr:hypothetical protein [Acidobacteriaceae bacterium]